MDHKSRKKNLCFYLLVCDCTSSFKMADLLARRWKQNMEEQRDTNIHRWLANFWKASFDLILVRC